MHKLNVHTFCLIQEVKGVPIVFATRTDGVECTSIQSFWDTDKHGKLLKTIKWREDVVHLYDYNKWAWSAEILMGTRNGESEDGNYSQEFKTSFGSAILG